MEVLNAAVLARWAANTEQWVSSGLGGKLTSEIESDLAKFPVGDAAKPNGLRWARALYWYWKLFEEAQAARAIQPETARAAASALIRREPVIAELAGAPRRITGRSFNALIEMTAHEMAMRRIENQVRKVQKLHAEAIAGGEQRIPRARSLERRHTVLCTELLLHRRAFYAHAMTPTGAPAKDIREAPAWWIRTTPVDDTRLFLGFWEVGPGRLLAMDQSDAKEDDDKDSPWAEPLGIHNILAWFENKRGLLPGDSYSLDIGQLLASMRAGALRYPELPEV